MGEHFPSEQIGLHVSRIRDTLRLSASNRRTNADDRKHLVHD